MKLFRFSGPFLIILGVALPIILWLPQVNVQNDSSLLRSFGQASAITGSVLICMEFVLSARIRWLEYLFSGLNRMYIIHALLGSIGFAMILLHPIFLTLSYLTFSITFAASFLTPSLQNIPVLVGMLALGLMIFLMVLTLYVKLEYDSWKRTHRWLGLVLILASIHAFLENSTFAPSKPLEVYMFTIFFMGIVAFFYKQLSKRLGINIYKYKVTNVNVSQDVTLLDLEPVAKKLVYRPGQFVFIDFNRKGIAKQSHPFSITSAPTDTKLSFAIRSLGDFTETLKLLSIGTLANIEGAFGRFSYTYFKNKNQVWIAGGIGVTPFIGMLRSLTPNDNMNIYFIYSVKAKEEALYLDELTQLATTLPNFHFDLYVAKDRGMLTGPGVYQMVNDLASNDIFICGPPPMMKALRSQFNKLGIKNSKIHTEEFALS